MNIALKEIDGKRKLFVAEAFVLERCQTLDDLKLRRLRSKCVNAWEFIKEQGIRYYDFATIPNRAPHFVVDHLGNAEDLVKIARFGDPKEVQDKAKEKLLKAFEEMSDLTDLNFYYDYKDENNARIRKEVADMYFEAYTWLKLIHRYFSNGWIQLGLPTKRDMMKLIVELLGERQIKGLKITNTDALQRKMNWYREHKGDKRTFVIHKNLQNKNGQKVNDEMVDLFKSLFSGQSGVKLNFEEACLRYNQFVAGTRHFINTDTGEVYDPKNYEKVSRSTIKNYLYKYDNKIGVFATRSGDWNKFSQENIPSWEFEMPKYANSLLSIDDFQPPFLMRGNKRAWFYGGVDLASGAWVSWVYGKHNEKNLVFLKKFYIQLLLNYHKWGLGMPKEIEMESSLNASLKDTLLRPNVLTEKATIYQNRPSPKKIERYIGMIRNEKARLHPNYQARPFTKAEYLAKGSTDPKEMEYEDIIRLYLKYIEEENNEPCEQDKSMTRIEYFLKNQNQSCQPIQWTRILPYLGYHTYATIRAGKVLIKGSSYLLGNQNEIAFGDELKGYASQLNDSRISIYYIQDENYNHVAAAIYTEDDRYICSLHPTPKPQKAHAEKTDEDRVKAEIMAKYQNTFISNVKENKASIQPIKEVIAEELELVAIEVEEPEIMPSVDGEIYNDETSTTTNVKSTWNRF